MVVATAAIACGSSDTRTDTTLADTLVTTQASPAWTVWPGGIGNVRVGMSLSALGAAAGESLSVPAAEAACGYVRPAALPPGVSLMIVRDTLARIDVDSTGVRTKEGAAVGDTEASVLARYGASATVQPHKYTGPAGHNVVVAVAGDSIHLLIFETDGQHVTRFRAGRGAEVSLVERCG